MSSWTDLPADQQTDGSRRRSRGVTYNNLHPESILFPPESREAYLALREEMLKEFAPQDDAEKACVDHLIMAAWREQQLEKYYNRSLQLSHVPRFADLHRMIDRCLTSNDEGYNFFLDQFIQIRTRRLRILKMFNPPKRRKKPRPADRA